MSIYSDQFLEFVKNTPNAYVAVQNIAGELDNAGYKQLREEEEWKIEAGKYYVIRNDASIIALDIPKDFHQFLIIASHGDSPCFRIKPNAVMEQEGYIKLNTEIYGGMIRYSWLDRPLSFAGRITYKKDGRYEKKTISIDKDLLVIPSLAVHMHREVNDSAVFNPQKDLLPLMMLSDKKESLLDYLKEETGEDVIDYDLYVYNRDIPKYIGANNEFILSPRIDNLGCAFTSLKAFLNSANENAVRVYVCFNNEETGSCTMEAADSTFLSDVLERVSEAFSKDVRQLLAASYLISADNGHALHPNYPEKCDPTNRPKVNGGLLIKRHENYTTDGFSAGVLKDILNQAGVKYQEFAARSDMRNGSTLGKISLSHVSVPSVDIGMAQLAMHSANELCGAKDIDTMIEGMKSFYGADICFSL